MFSSSGAWTFYNDNVLQSSGSYSLVSRNPLSHTVVFKVNPDPATQYGHLDEVFGYFYMNNGPASFKTIKYVYQGN